MPNVRHQAPFTSAKLRLMETTGPTLSRISATGARSIRTDSHTVTTMVASTRITARKTAPPASPCPIPNAMSPVIRKPTPTTAVMMRPMSRVSSTNGQNRFRARCHTSLVDTGRPSTARPIAVVSMPVARVLSRNVTTTTSTATPPSPPSAPASAEVFGSAPDPGLVNAGSVRMRSNRVENEP